MQVTRRAVASAGGPLTRLARFPMLCRDERP